MSQSCLFQSQGKVNLKSEHTFSMYLSNNPSELAEQSIDATQ